MISPADHDLLQAYLEGRLSAEQTAALEARLKTDRDLALAYVALAREETVFRRWSALDPEAPAAACNGRARAAVTAFCLLPPAPLPPQQKGWGRRPWRVALGLAVALLIGLAIYCYRPGPGNDLAVVPVVPPAPPPPPARQGPTDPGPDIARLEGIRGHVSLVDAGTTTRVRSGQPVRAGQTIRLETDGSSAVIRYDDGTVLELGPDTQVRLEQDAGKRVFLSSGVLTANVAPQPAPMIVSTPHAEIKVLGTRFCSISGAQATHVELEEGKIELTRKSDGRTIEVQPGMFAVASAQAEALTPFPLPPRITRERRQHLVGEGPVLSLAISPDGQLLAAGGWQGTIHIWNYQTGEEHRMLGGHSRKVRSLVFTPDNQRLISTSEDRSIRVWKLADGSMEKSLPSHRDLEALAVSPDGQVLAAGGWGRAAQEIQLFDLPTLQPTHTFQRHQGSVTSLSFTPNSRYLASASKDGTVKLWDLANRSELATLPIGTQPVRSVAFSPDGQRLALGTSDGAIQLWNWMDSEVQLTLQSRMGMVACVAFSPDGRILASSGGRGSVTLWDLVHRSEGPTFHGHSFMVPAIAFAPDGKSLASAGWNRTVKLWDLTGNLGDQKNKR